MPKQRLPERVAKRLLDRAVQLDEERGRGFDLAELRAIAREVGVSEESFDLALEELRSAGELDGSTDVRAGALLEVARLAGGRGRGRKPSQWARLKAWAGGLAIGVGSYVLGAIAAGFEARGASEPSAILFFMMVGASALLVMDRRRSREPLRYLGESAALWLPFPLGWAAGIDTGYLVDDVAAVAAIAWAVAAVVGLAVVTLDIRRGKGAHEADLRVGSPADDPATEPSSGEARTAPV